MNTHHKNREEIWIGLAKVQAGEQQSDSKGSSKAYVNVVGLAKNKIDFKKRIKEELAHLNFSLMRLEEPEFFSKRISAYKVDESLYRLVEDLLAGGDEKIKFSTFHTYD